MINYFEWEKTILSQPPATTPAASLGLPAGQQEQIAAATDPWLDLDRSFIAGANLALAGQPAAIEPPGRHSEAFIAGVTPDSLRPLCDRVCDLLMRDGDSEATVNGTRAVVSRAAYIYEPADRTIPPQRVRVGYPLPADREKLAEVEPWLVFAPAASEDTFPDVITSNQNYFGAMEFRRLPGQTLLFGIGGDAFAANNPADIAAGNEIINGLEAACEARLQAEAEAAAASQRLLEAETRALIDATKAERQLRRETKQIKRQGRLDRIEGWLDQIALDQELHSGPQVTYRELVANSVVRERPTAGYEATHAAPVKPVSYAEMSPLDRAIGRAFGKLAVTTKGLTAELTAKSKEMAGKRWLIAAGLLTGISIASYTEAPITTESYHQLQPRLARAGAVACTAAFDATIDSRTIRSEICQRATPFTVTNALPLAPHGTAELPIDQVVADTAYTKAVPHHFSVHPTDTVITTGLSRYTVAAGASTPSTAGNDCAYTGYIGGDFRPGRAAAFGVDPDTSATLTVVNDHTLEVCVLDTSTPNTVFIDQK